MIETEGLTKRFGEKVAVSDLSLRVEAGEVMGFLGPNGSGKTTTIRLLMGLLRPSAGRCGRAVIETEALTKAFGPKVAVNALSLRVEAGEVMGFLGPNGSGKTTTIRLLMGLLRPTAGSARILGRDCHADGLALKRVVGYLPDEPFLYPYLSGREVLELVAGLHGMTGAEARRRAERAAADAGLGEAASAYTVTYSLGMKKRTALAMALIHDPQVLILDEPTNGLDPRGAREMRDTIARLAAGGRTILMSTHLLEAAERLCRRVAIIGGGVLKAVGTPDELRARFAAAPDASLEDVFLHVTEPPAP